MVGEQNSALSKADFALSGAISGFCTRCMLQVEPVKKTCESKYYGVVSAIKSIYKEEKIPAFWKGHVAAQYLSVTYSMTQFGAFEILTRHFYTETIGCWRPCKHFVFGAVAGCCATIAAQPFDVVRTRFVAQGQKTIYSSVGGAVKTISSTEGMAALYKGLVPTLMQIAPYAGFQFGFYSGLQMFWDRFSQKKSIARTFLVGATAGLCSKTLVYPLDLLKKRMQVVGFSEGRADLGITRQHVNFRDCVRSVLRDEGITALFKGWTPSALKAFLATALHFVWYEQACKLLLRVKYDVR